MPLAPGVQRRLLVRATAVLAISAVIVAMSAASSDAAARRSITFVAPASATTGANISVSGQVTHSPKGTSVIVGRQSGKSWVVVARVRTTNAAGAYKAKFAVPRTRGTYAFRAWSAKTVKLALTTSTTRKIAVRTPVSVTLVTSTSSTTNGSNVTLSGKVTPWVVGTAVTLQDRVGSATTWSTVKALSPLASGSWSTTVVPASSSTTQYRVVVAARGYYLGATSGTASVTTAPAVVTPAITSTYVPDGTISTAYSTTLTANESGTWAITSGALPNGLTLDPSSGAVTGTPTTTGPSTFTVTFTDGRAQTADEQFSMSIDPAPTTTFTPMVSAGDLDTCRIVSTGALQCWGSDEWGELGVNGDTLHQQVLNTPQTVASGSKWLDVSAGTNNGLGEHVCGIEADYSLWCWGSGFSGELGQGYAVQEDGPTSVAAGTHWSQVASGGMFTCGIRTDQTLWCWGSIGASGVSNGPMQFGTSSQRWLQVAAGNIHACAIDTAHHLWCWGQSYNGWIGDGNSGTVYYSEPHQIGTATWSQVSASPGDSCGVQTDGTLWCWGANAQGQLGLGNGNAAVDVPTQVGTATTWSQVSTGGESGGDNTCATQTDDSLWCWGGNYYGQSTGTTTSDTPVQVATGFSSVSAGGVHTCGLVSGATYCWGDDNNGEIGDGRGNGSGGTAVTPVTTPLLIS